MKLYPTKHWYFGLIAFSAAILLMALYKGVDALNRTEAVIFITVWFIFSTIDTYRRYTRRNTPIFVLNDEGLSYVSIDGTDQYIYWVCVEQARRGILGYYIGMKGKLTLIPAYQISFSDRKILLQEIKKNIEINRNSVKLSKDDFKI